MFFCNSALQPCKKRYIHRWHRVSSGNALGTFALNALNDAMYDLISLFPCDIPKSWSKYFLCNSTGLKAAVRADTKDAHVPNLGKGPEAIKWNCPVHQSLALPRRNIVATSTERDDARSTS
eukprot:jgi/Botrbrau1/4888/Bobra.118_1s0002.1